MSKFIDIIIGGAEIIGGVILVATGVGGPIGGYLIASGVGMVLAGIGTLLTGTLSGTSTLSRNPVAPWNVVYGRQKLGGVLVYIAEHDDDNKYLDLVIMLAAHPCQSVDALLLDGQRVLMDVNGCSFTPTQQTINLTNLTRSNGVVTATLSSAITFLETADSLIIQNVSDATFNGRYPVTVIDSTHFSYICGGTDTTVASSGQAVTFWPDYRAKIHMEALLGTHTSTFPGMLTGTPYDGDPTNLVTYPGNPWTADHKLLGKTSVFLRFHYNDEVFANGLPTIAFRLSGKKDIYDPRTSPATYGYTENPALCIADYLAQPVFGFGAAYGTEIPINRLILAANICDELVPLATGGSEARYTCNGGFPLTMKRGEVLQNLLTSCGGRLTYTQGQFVIWPAAWMGSGVIPSPPFPVPTGQAVAWSLPTTSSPNPYGFFDVAPSVFNLFLGVHGYAFANLNGGQLWLINGEGIGFNTCDAFWGGFALPPEIPPGATIRHVYPVVIVSGLTGGGGKFIASSLGNFLSGNGTNVGLDLGTVTGASIQAEISDSVAGASYIAFNVDFVGLAVYYDLGTSNPIVPFGGTAETLAIAAGPFRWREKVSIRDLYNGVKGTYISPANNWESSDIPPYAQDADHGYPGSSPAIPFNDLNLAADGGDRRWLDIQLPFTISVATAQRLCKIELMRRRQQGTGTFTYNMAMYKTTVLDIVQMTLPLLNWVNKYLEISAHRFTINKQQVDGDEVTLLGSEIDVQETDPSVYTWSTSEELSAKGFQQPTLPGSIDGGGSTLIDNSTYINTPAIALSQPDATHIALAAVSTAFAGGTVNYNARSISITDPGGSPTWYYVTIGDPDYLGDQSPQLAVYAETTTAKVGVAGYTYMGAIQVTHAAGASATPLPGGWPAPTSFVNVS